MERMRSLAGTARTASRWRCCPGTGPRSSKYRKHIGGRRFLLVLGDRKGRGEYVLLKLDDYVELLKEVERAVDQANHG